MKSLRHFIEERRELLLEMMRFGTVGGASAVVYAITIVACLYVFKLGAAVSTIPAYLASMVLNYALQKSWTFRSEARHVSSGPKYLCIHGVGILINYATVEIAMSAFAAPYLLAQAVAVALVALWSYLGQKYWTFAADKTR